MSPRNFHSKGHNFCNRDINLTAKFSLSTIKFTVSTVVNMLNVFIGLSGMNYAYLSKCESTSCFSKLSLVTSCWYTIKVQKLASEYVRVTESGGNQNSAYYSDFVRTRSAKKRDMTLVFWIVFLLGACMLASCVIATPSIATGGKERTFEYSTFKQVINPLFQSSKLPKSGLRSWWIRFFFSTLYRSEGKRAGIVWAAARAYTTQDWRRRH